MPQVLPYITLGLGVFQTLQSQNVMNQALAEAAKPKLSAEQQSSLRTQGTSNIGANLASRGLLDSSLYGGALANLEKSIGEAAAGAGTAGNVPDMLWQQALGLGQSGSAGIGNIAQLYLLRQLYGQGMPTSTSWGSSSGTQLPWWLMQYPSGAVPSIQSAGGL